MSYTLFIDDVRSPTPDLGRPELAINVAEAIDLVNILGLPERISFDHDLGKNEPTAMIFMKWLVEGHLDERFDLNTIKEIIIHSANPVGAGNLQGLWNGFAKSELDSGVLAIMRPR